MASRYDGLMACSLCYYREYRGRGVVAVIQWILTEHYQEGRVSEELLKEMLFWSCRYVHTQERQSPAKRAKEHLNSSDM